jgi:hypothetical protein
LEAPEQRLVAALGAEVVGDQEQLLAVGENLGGEWLTDPPLGPVKRLED